MLCGRPYHLDAGKSTTASTSLSARWARCRRHQRGNALGGLLHRAETGVLNQWTYHARLYGGGNSSARSAESPSTWCSSSRSAAASTPSPPTRCAAFWSRTGKNLHPAQDRRNHQPGRGAYSAAEPFSALDDTRKGGGQNSRDHFTATVGIHHRNEKGAITPSSCRTWRRSTFGLAERVHQLRVQDGNITERRAARSWTRGSNTSTTTPATPPCWSSASSSTRCSGRYDPHKVALIITQTGGGCRASNYIHLLRKALAKAGYSYVPVISLSMTGLEKKQRLPHHLPRAADGDRRARLR